MKNIIFATTIAALTFTSTLSAAPLFQAGDIANGGSSYYVLTSAHRTASYFAKGNDGTVSFKCLISGEGIIATLIPGKNFKNMLINKPEVLKDGFNGPFTWRLQNLGSSVGNIKVRLITGDYASMQCYQVPN